MLIGISRLLTPGIFHAIYMAGHLDEIVIADGNYSSFAMGSNIVRSETDRNDLLLSAILKYVPIDDDGPHPASVMSLDDSIYPEPPLSWELFQQVLGEASGKNIELNYVKRQDFYQKTRHAFVTIQTCDCRPHATIVIRKGMILEADFKDSGSHS